MRLLGRRIHGPQLNSTVSRSCVNSPCAQSARGKSMPNTISQAPSPESAMMSIFPCGKPHYPAESRPVYTYRCHGNLSPQIHLKVLMPTYS